MELTPEQELARLRVAVAKGLTADQAARLTGTTPEELEADADALKAAFQPPAAEPAPRGPILRHGSGRDVGAGNGLSDGAARYRAKHGLDENGQRPAPEPVKTSQITQTRTGYTMGSGR